MRKDVLVIAWVSRHSPLPSQISALKLKLGKVKIVHVLRTFKNAEDVLSDIKATGAKYAVVVLPLSMIAELLPLAKRERIILLWAEMKGLHECLGPEECDEFNADTDVWLPLYGGPKGRHMRFIEFKIIKAIRMELEPLFPRFFFTPEASTSRKSWGGRR